MRTTSIESSRQVLVEGRSALEFLKALIKGLGLPGFQLHNFGGVDDFKQFIGALRLSPGFDQTVRSIAVIRDAENDAAAAFQSVKNSLLAVNFPAPVELETFSGDPLKVGVYLFPGGGNPGMLETFCLKSVAEDQAMKCVEDYFACLNRLEIPRPSNLEKAKAQAFLASRERPGLLVGQAAHAGYWRFDNVVLDGLKEFLNQM